MFHLSALILKVPVSDHNESVAFLRKDCKKNQAFDRATHATAS